MPETRLRRLLRGALARSVVVVVAGAAAGMIGCAGRGVQTDDAGRSHVTCAYSGALACHRDARAHCGKAGYQVLSEVTDAGSQAGGADVSLITVRERVRILTFVCKDH